MAKNRVFDLPKTKGSFQVKGKVNGTQSKRFYTSKTTKTGKDFRAINMGVAYDDHTSVYLSLNGMPQQNVYFSNRGDNGKTETKAVPWANRNKFNEDGFRLIGVNLGLEKTEDESGNSVNLKKTMTGYDACEYIKAKAKDDMSVFVRGQLDFSSYMDKDNNIRRSLKYVPNQISLCKDVNFDEYDDENNKPVHDFTQTIIFMDITKEKDEKEHDTGRFVVEAKIVTYNDIVDTEFIITDSKLAGLLKKNLKSYNAITVHGKIEVSHSIQETTDEDEWGEANPMSVVSAPTKVELIITGAAPATIDKETYTESAVSEAIKAIRNAKNAENKFADVNDSDSTGWGDDSDLDDDAPWD